MDLIGGYLLILLVLFTANIALMLGNYKFENLRLIVIDLIFSIAVFVLLNTPIYSNELLLDNFSYIFLALAIIIFILTLYYSKKDNFKISTYSLILIFAVSVVMFSSQSDLDFFNRILYSLVVFVIFFIVYQLSKLLHHAKRQYPIIIGEYMCLFAVLMFIFALTYNSTKALDYSMFSSFLILTPTYQLIYVIIAIIVILVIGVIINDNGGNS